MRFPFPAVTFARPTAIRTGQHATWGKMGYCTTLARLNAPGAVTHCSHTLVSLVGPCRAAVARVAPSRFVQPARWLFVHPQSRAPWRPHLFSDCLPSCRSQSAPTNDTQPETTPARRPETADN